VTLAKYTTKMIEWVSKSVWFNVPPDTGHFGDGFSRQNA